MIKRTVISFLTLTLLTTYYGANANLSPLRPNSVEFAAEQPQITVLSPVVEEQIKYKISVFDHTIKAISEEQGNDWRLMSAIAYHESRFTADIVSPRGARGLMQIMPRVARQFDIEPDELTNPEVNIKVANMVFNKIVSSLRIPLSVSNHDRLCIALACYNGGIGHVGDARRLAKVNGENFNSWSVVSRYLKLKSQPEYYEHEVVKCGKFIGSGETLAFVSQVIGRYDNYCRKAEL